MGIPKQEVRLPGSFGGICSVNPFAVKSSLCDNLEGVDRSVLSSLALPLGSLNFGDGDSVGVESESDRVFEGVFVAVRDNASARGRSLPLNFPSCLSKGLAWLYRSISCFCGGGPKLPKVSSTSYTDLICILL